MNKNNFVQKVLKSVMKLEASREIMRNLVGDFTSDSHKVKGIFDDLFEPLDADFEGSTRERELLRQMREASKPQLGRSYAFYPYTRWSR